MTHWCCGFLDCCDLWFVLLLLFTVVVVICVLCMLAANVLIWWLCIVWLFVTSGFSCLLLIVLLICLVCFSVGFGCLGYSRLRDFVIIFIIVLYVWVFL